MINELVTKILIIEDDFPLAELISDYLIDQGYDVTHADSAYKVKQLSSSLNFNLIICDLMLPDIHGFKLFDLMKKTYNCPVIFLTANSDDDSQITGLNLGAVDYIIKPVDPRLLLARIKAALRDFNSTVESSKVLKIGRLSLELDSYNATFDNINIQLTNHEFDLMSLFVSNVGKILERDVLFEQTIGREYNGLDRTLDARISRLRKKLDDLHIPSLTIKTIWGKGYLFNYNDASRKT